MNFKELTDILVCVLIANVFWTAESLVSFKNYYKNIIEVPT